MKKLFMILFAGLLFSSCTKQGPAGTNGKTGNANVQTALFSTPTTASWSQKFGQNVWVVQFSVPQFTAAVVNSGAVMVYIGSCSANTPAWTAIPCDINGTDYSYTVGFGNLEIDAFMSTGQLPPNPALDHNHTCIKVVSIPPAIILSHPDLNFKDYAAVEKALMLN
jgi:hypothetical protein